jgi:hypothetical protein
MRRMGNSVVSGQYSVVCGAVFSKNRLITGAKHTEYWCKRVS